MFHAVAQTFLSDAKDTQSYIFIKLDGESGLVKVHFELSSLSEISAETLHGCQQSEMIQFRGMKFVRQPMNLRGQFICLILYRLDGFSQLEGSFDFFAELF